MKEAKVPDRLLSLVDSCGGVEVALMGFKAAVLADRQLLGGATFIGGGVPVIGFGAAFLSPVTVVSGSADWSTRRPKRLRPVMDQMTQERRRIV